MDPADPSAPEDTVVQNDHYTIARRRTGEFMLFRLAGRCMEAILDDLRSHVFIFKTHYALDTSALGGITAAFARELVDTAASLRSGERRLVLINPPAGLRTLLSLHGGKSSVEMVLSEEHLKGSGFGAEAGQAHALRELERIREQFQSDRRWQFIDREGCWICPYCARVQETVRVASPLSVSAQAVERAYHHLWSKCPDFKPTSQRLRSAQELLDALRRANDEKLVVSRTTMARMESQIAALKGKTEELEENVRKASERQRRLLPAEAPDVPGAEIDLIYRPAEEVSGDFYDFVPLENGRIAFLVGDVSGHGIAAGVVMGMAKKVLSLRLQDYQDPIRALIRTNIDVDKDLARLSFVTAFVGIFDPAARTLTCARAGHNPPLLYNRHRPERCLQLDPSGMGLGLMDPSAFEPTIQTLSLDVLAGDVLLLFTDGLVEARNPQGDQFGVDRTIEVLSNTHGYPPALVLSTLSGTLDRFTGARVSDDDLTAVCVRFI